MAAERQAADAHASAAKAREDAVADVAAKQQEAHATIAALLDRTRSHSDMLQAALAEASEGVRGRTQAAYAEAERIKAEAVSEAGALVAQARLDAEALVTQADAERVARNEQLRRDNRMLRQRKQALLGQLAQLSSLATATADEFPEDEQTGPIPAGLLAEPAIVLDDELDDVDDADADGEADPQ